MQRRCGDDRARLADPLHPERVPGRRRLHLDRLERHELGGRDEGVVGEVRRARHAVLVDHLLVQRGGDGESEPAVHLALGDHRVQDRAGVVDRDELAHAGHAGLGVELDDSHARTERERAGAALGLEAVLGIERAEVGPRQRPGRRTGDEEAGGDTAARGACLEHDVGDIGLEQLGRAATAQLDDVARRAVRGRPAQLGRARADRAAAERREVGVAVAHDDAAAVDAQLAHHDIGERGLVTLPVRRRADHHGYGAVVVHGDAGRLALAAAGDLDGAADTDAELQRSTLLASGRLLGP